MNSKEFLFILRKNLLDHGFNRLDSRNYYYVNNIISCLFDIQKSKHGQQYFFNIYFKLSSDDIKEKSYHSLAGDRLHKIFPEYHEIITAIDFDNPNLIKSYIDEFIDHLPYILNRLKEMTDIHEFIDVFHANFSQCEIEKLKSNTFTFD